MRIANHTAGKRKTGSSIEPTTMIGLAYGPGVPGFVAGNPNVVDYVELPFELLRHDPSAIEAGGPGSWL